MHSLNRLFKRNQGIRINHYTRRLYHELRENANSLQLIDFIFYGIDRTYN